MQSEEPRTIKLGRGHCLIYESEVMAGFIKRVRQFARTKHPVLILGETGTGKELIARLIHRESGSKKRPFVSFNSAGLTEQLASSELFGHEKGAFTNADSMKDGLFHEAKGGTLFLDEVGDIHEKVQPLLLRVLALGEVRRVGSTEAEKIPVRIVSATNRRLDTDVEAGTFRRDLYDRLAHHRLLVPPLRDRGRDVLAIAQDYTTRNRKGGTLRRDAQAALLAYDWPSNVRELRSVLDNAMAITQRKELQGPDFAGFLPSWVPLNATLTKVHLLRAVNGFWEHGPATFGTIAGHLGIVEGSRSRVFSVLKSSGLIVESVDQPSHYVIPEDTRRVVQQIRNDASQAEKTLTGFAASSGLDLGVQRVPTVRSLLWSDASRVLDDMTDSAEVEQ